MMTLAKGGTQASNFRCVPRIQFIPEPESGIASSGTPQDIDPTGVTTDPTGKLFHELRVYLWKLAGKYGDEAIITQTLADSALKMWGRLFCNGGGDLAIPDAAPGGEGEIYLIWRRDGHYLSLVMQEGSEYELFYRNECSGDIWAIPVDPHVPDFPEEVIDKLNLFPPSY